MGLTIQYRLSTRRRFDLVAVHELIQRLHAQARALRFAQVGKPYFVGPDYTWAFHWPSGAKKIGDLLAPLEGWIFNATPGDGSESVAVGLCRYQGVNGWRLVVIGQDQERLGTGMSEAWPSAALFVSCIILVLFLVLRIALRFYGRELPRHTPLEVE